MFSRSIAATENLARTHAPLKLTWYGIVVQKLTEVSIDTCIMISIVMDLSRK